MVKASLKIRPASLKTSSVTSNAFCTFSGVKDLPIVLLIVSAVDFNLVSNVSNSSVAA